MMRLPVASSFVVLILTTAAAGAARPNVLVLLVDDLGWRDVGFNGSSFYETPNIDRFAASGVVFPNAYAACPVCSPTRASLLTGRHPVRVDVTDWLKGMEKRNIRDHRLLTPVDRDELALEEVTIAEHLREYGYQTFFVGKWHLGGQGYHPEQQGFDVNIGGYAKGSPPGGYYAPFKNPKLADRPDDQYLTDRLTNESLRLLRERDDTRPFLLYLSYYNVHTPIQPNRELVDRFALKSERIAGPTPVRSEHTAVTRMRQDDAAFASMVASVDKSVGRVLSELEDLRIADDTVVVFVSDNGGLSTHLEAGPTSNHPLRAGKGWLYEGGIRVPMAIRAPGTTNPGSVVDAPVTSADLFPTVLDVAGLPARPDLHRDGVSLAPLMQGGAIEPRALYWHYPHYHGSQWMPGAAVRDGDWKLVEHYHWRKTELFNLVTDPSEQRDLSSANPKKTEELLTKLREWQDRTNAKLPQPKVEEGVSSIGSRGVEARALPIRRP